MTYVLLKIVSLFRGLYTAMGVDFNQLHAIVGTKLVMDNRRNANALNQQKKDLSNRFLLTIFMYAFFGAFIAAAIAFLPSFLIGMTLYHSFLIVMIGMTLISDFSSVLLDTSDNTIILPRPVSGKTLMMARVTHILLYLGQITTGLMLFPLLVTIYKFGAITGAVFFLTTILSVLFAVILTNMVYLLIMQWTSEERLKSVINYFQIGMSLVMMGGYQILPRMMSADLIKEVDFELSWWSVFIPPFWMAGALEMIKIHSPDLLHIALLLLAVAIPVGGFYILNKYLSPIFADKLADLGTGNVSASSQAKENKVARNTSRFQVKSWITTTGLERGSYEIVSAFISRDRKLKLKIYPSIGTVFIMSFVFMYQGKHSVKIMLNDLPNGSGHILLLYTAFLVLQTVLSEVCYTDEFRAAWIYSAAPIKRPGEILSGTLKAILVKFFVPIYLLFSVFILVIWKSAAIDDIVFGVASNIALFFLVGLSSQKNLPMSLEPSLRNQSGTIVRVLIMGIILAFAGGLHFLLSKFGGPYALWAATPVMCILGWFLMKEYKNVKWVQIGK